MAHFAKMFVVIGMALSCQALFAQLPTPRLDVISPPAGKVGTEVDVTLIGAELEQCNQLVFTHPGITATQEFSETDEIDTTALPIPRRFTIKIANDVAPGIYEVRATGPLGATNPRLFAVDTLETIVESGNHRTRDSAMELPLGVAVTGTVDAGAFDFYRFDAKKSQSLLIDCYGQRLGSRLDATLAVYDANGARLKLVRDVARLDPVIKFIAPEDGDYYVCVYDFEFNGGNEYFYRLSVHEGPYVAFVFPPVAPPGESGKFKIYGHNLPGAKTIDGMMIAQDSVAELSVDVPMGDPSRSQGAAACLMETPDYSSLDRKLFRFATPQGAANPVTIGYATAPVVVEQEPNNQPEDAQQVDAPCELVGQFYPRGDRDAISIAVKKGDVYWLELLSSRLGVPSDTHMLIEKVTTNEKGEAQTKLVAEVDDRPKQTVDANSVHVYFTGDPSDPSYKLTADADATYRITIKDLFGNANNDPRFFYRLLVRKEDPDFRLLAYSAPIAGNKNQVAPSATIVRRGGNAAIHVRIMRQHGFDGDVEISAEGLPSGVVCHGAVAGGNVNQVSLVFSAEENVSAWSGPIRIIGRANVDQRELTRQARCAAFIWGTANAQQNQPVVQMVDDVTLAVVEKQKAPLSVQLGDAALLKTARGGKLEIPIKTVRGEDVPGDLKMKMIGVPGVNLKDTTVKGNEGKYLLEVTDQRFPVGHHTVLLTGTAKYKYEGDSDAIKKVEDEGKRLEGIVKRIAEQEKEAQQQLLKAKEAANAEKEDQALAEAVKNADEEVKRLGALSKRAVQRKQANDKKLSDIKNKNKPRDLNVPFVSTPVRLHVAASPVTLNLDALPSLKPGDKSELAAKVEKRFEFDDVVNLSIEVPAGLKGVSVKPLKIEKGQTEGKLELQLANDATPGTHTLKVRSKLKFNNINIDTTDELTLTIETIEATASK